jgi:rod shape-determining protein MreD
MILRSLLSLLIVSLLLVVQSTWLEVISIYGVKPDISLIVIIYIAFKNPGLQGQTVGFASGLLQDSISMSPLGLNAFIKTSVALIANLLSGKFYIDWLLMPGLFGFVSILLKALYLYFLSMFFGGKIIVYQLFSSTLWLEALYTAIASPIIFLILRPIDRFIVPMDSIHE